jgi:hypothetical protein
MTDKEMAAFLSRSEEAVMQKRRKMGLKKSGQDAEKSIEAAIEAHNEVRSTTALQDLTDSQKRAELISQLVNSPRWARCQTIFSEEELRTYKHDWVEFRMTYDSLNPVELGTLHVLLLAQIRLDRYQRMEREIKESHKGWTNELQTALVSVHREIREMNEVYMKALDKLSASREARIKREGEQKVTLLTLLKELELKEGREKMAKESDALKFIGQIERDRLSKEGYLRGT